nr:hypothetical protein [Tanacetum cinerariifolium]
GGVNGNGEKGVEKMYSDSNMTHTRNLGRPNNRELGYIDAKMPKYVNKEGGQGQSKVGEVKKPIVQPNFPCRLLVHRIILIGQNRMHLLWDMKLVIKNIKCFLSKNTLNNCNGTHDERKKAKNLTWKLEILQRTVKRR